MMDNLMEGLERDEEYKAFHLDGQTIVLNDYLELRSERKARLEKLIRDGRILIGPWYVMPDEFLVSGEALIKNLQMGHRICREYGVEPMKNGYVTDIFGHNSQLPQILNGFEIHSATLYRGIGDYEKDAFCWRSPDGSDVIAAKLEAECSYSNFYFAVRRPYEGKAFDEAGVVERMKVLADRARRMAASHVELDTLVHPSQGISRIGEDSEAVALYSKGLYEIEVTENRERALALTLFRAAEGETGTAHPEDIKMQRTMTFSYALSLARQSITRTLLEGEQYRMGIRDFRFEQNAQAEMLEGDMAFLKVSDSEKIISHVSGEVSGTEARILCPAHKIVTVRLELESGRNY